MAEVEISVAPASLVLTPDRELPVNVFRSLLDAVSVSPALEAMSAALDAVSVSPALEAMSAALDAVSVSPALEAMSAALDAVSVSPALEAMSAALDAASMTPMLASISRVASASDLAFFTERSGWIPESVSWSSQQPASIAELLDRSDLEDLIDQELFEEQRFSQVVASLRSGRCDVEREMDVVRFSIRNVDGRLFRSARLAAALLVGVLCWASDATMNGDISPAAAVAVAVSVYTALRRA